MCAIFYLSTNFTSIKVKNKLYYNWVKVIIEYKVLWECKGMKDQD